MSSTLSEGVRVPDIGSVNWGADVNFNWGLLNTALANISGNVKTDVANTWTAPQTFSETISGSIDGVAARAVNDEDGNNIKSALAGKQPSLSQAQLDAVNSGITAAAVQQIGTNADNISALQTAVSGKAADNAVVHLAGAETISGDKTWTGANTFSGNATFTGTGKIIRGLGTVDITQTTYSENISQGYFTYQDAVTRYFGGFGHRVETDGTSVFIFDNSNFTTGGTQGVVTLRFEYKKDFTYSLCCGGANLGNTTRKWKTLNGINPGALGMIDISTYVDIDTSTWVSDGVAANRVYINGANPTFPGYLFIRAAGSSTDFLAVRLAGTTTDKPMWTAPYYPASGGLLYVIVPCPASTSIRVYTTVAPTVCRYYACLGNV